MRRTKALAIGISVLLVPATVSSAPKPAPQGMALADAPVTVAQSDPIPGVGIVIKRNPGGKPSQIVSRSDGGFSFSGLQPGSYTLTAVGQPPVTVVVGADGQMAGVVTTKGLAISDAPVPVAQSNPIPGVGIVIKRNPGGKPSQIVSRSDGGFSFSGLLPGSYTLTVAGQPPVTVVVGADGQLAGIATTKGVQLGNAGKMGSSK